MLLIFQQFDRYIKGDEIIVPSHTCVLAISFARSAKIVWADIDVETLIYFDSIKNYTKTRYCCCYLYDYLIYY